MIMKETQRFWTTEGQKADDVLVVSVPLTLVGPAMGRRGPGIRSRANEVQREETRAINYGNSDRGIRNIRTQVGQREERREKRARRAQPQACISASKAFRQRPRYN